MASSFPNLVLSGDLLFQTTTILWHNNLHGPIRAATQTVSCHISSFVCFKKNKTSGSLPVVERWKSYMLPNHSSFALIEEEHFLVGTRVHSALEKTTSYYLKNEFRSSARRFLVEFTSTVLSTVAARFKLGQGISCFCTEIIIGAMTIPPSFSSDIPWKA